MMDFTSSAFAGTFIGAILSFVKNWQQQSHEYRLAVFKQQSSLIEESLIKSPLFIQISRFVLALLVFSYFFVLPAIATLMGWQQYIAFDEDNGWIMSLFSGNYTVVWKTFGPGYIITPAQIYIVSQISTMYFLGRSFR